MRRGGPLPGLGRQRRAAPRNPGHDAQLVDGGLVDGKTTAHVEFYLDVDDAGAEQRKLC